MSRTDEVIEAGKRHHITIKNQRGKPLIKMPLFLAVIIFIGAPQLLLVMLIGMVLEMIFVEYDGEPVRL